MKKKRHPLRKLLIVLTLLAAYACAIILPYARQPAVTADTAGSSRPPAFTARRTAASGHMSSPTTARPWRSASA